MTTPQKSALDVRADSESIACSDLAIAASLPGWWACRGAQTKAHDAIFRERPARGEPDFARDAER
jgi:hypothetical protein